eukprot:363121-Prymnesium_polylepis.1
MSWHRSADAEFGEGEQPDRRERTRVCSAAGQHAGAWLGAVPVSDRLRAHPRLCQLALCMRLGVEISDLA